MVGSGVAIAVTHGRLTPVLALLAFGAQASRCDDDPARAAPSFARGWFILPLRVDRSETSLRHVDDGAALRYRYRGRISDRRVLPPHLTESLINDR